MAAAVAAMLLVGLLQGDTARASVLRFHHIHLRVADPAASSREAAAQLGATRTILQGHGISIRAGGEYLVFEREDQMLPVDDSDRYGPQYAAAVYLQAARWASGAGLAIEPADYTAVRLRGAISGNRIDRIAFSSANPAAAIEHLSKHGLTPFERADDVARFRLSGELTVEIMGETDRPDTYWCPMHPDIRAPGAGRCSLCSMDLVPIPPPRIGEYRLEVSATPAAGDRGIGGLRLRVIDPETNEPVARFLEVHDKPFHLFIVSRDLEYFAHVHPAQQADGSFAIELSLKDGEYLLVGDFLPAQGTPQMVQRAIITPGYAGKLFGASPQLSVTAPEQVVDGLRVRIEADGLAPLRPSMLRFVVSEAATGAAVTDLEPYLGAPGHLLVVDPDLKVAIHGHPEGRSSTGPAVTFDPVLPSPGRYKLWVQFQRKGRVVTVPFVIEVPEP